MKSQILLISKDVLMRSYLPVYGNKYNHTPNIDELAANGTVFLKHYTSAPSTAMAFTSMFTGLYAYETERKKYVEVSEYPRDTVFDKLSKQGYSCHIVWDKSYVHLAKKYSKCYGREAVIHSTTFLTQKQSPHVRGQYDNMKFCLELENYCIEETEKLTKELCENNPKLFMWIHFPHALLGRNAYGSDIDLLDQMVGMFRKYFDDSAIYITADHGHMNGAHGKFGYGFDLYQNAINIPLITPRIDGHEIVDYPTSNTQLGEILFGCLKRRDVVFSETAYYMQPHRKLVVICGRYKYIFEKQTGKEFLYDVEWDLEENINLLDTEIYDTDRRIAYSLTQRFFYPHWGRISGVAANLRKKKDALWRNAPWPIEITERLLFFAKNIYRKFQ